MKLSLSLPTSFAVLAAAGDTETGRREIAGFAVPWNVDAEDMHGTRVRFLPGSIPVDGPAPKLLRDHDLRAPIGIVTGRRATDAGVEFSARISQTRDGDDALALAADGVLDAVSVGVVPTEFTWQDGTLVVSAAVWNELSLVPFGAFTSARVHEVAASASTEPEPEPEADPEEDHVNPETELQTIPTNTLTLAAPAPTLVRFSAADYISAVVTGRTDAPVIRAAAAENVLADIPGIVPDPLFGAILDFLNNRRPVVTSFGVQAAPRAGETFYRRKVTQHTDVDVQTNEFDELASQAMTLGRVQVDKKLLGGYLDVSYQSVDFADVNAVQLILNDLARVYAKRTETKACTDLVAGATVTDSIADWTDGDEILDAVYSASATIDAAIDELPTTIWVSPDRWAQLGQAKAANGDRLFPVLGPSNAAGVLSPATFAGNPMGLRLVVSNKFAAETMIVGNPIGFELFEQSGGILRAEQPATASVRLALIGYFASVMMESGAFVKFIDAA